MGKGKKPMNKQHQNLISFDDTTIQQEIPSNTQQQTNNYDSDKTIQKFGIKFGPTGSRWLSVISSLLGTGHEKIKNIEILCDGQELQGYYSIDDLIFMGHLANNGVKANKKNPHLLYLSHIAAALPLAPFLFLETLDEDDETVARVIGHNINTSLPRSLRYFHAADLPLGQKTRKAHILWSIQFAKMIKSKFNAHIYQRCAQNAIDYIHLDRVMTLLNTIEANIILTHEEMLVSYPF